MDLAVRELVEGDIDAVVRLSLRAPVHASIRQAFGPELNDALNPDWRVSQERDVVAVCTSPANQVWVAESVGAVVGFVAVHVHDDRRIGEIAMLAVDPDAQNEGVGTTLTEARRTYEKAGFTLVPVARYFLKL